MRMWTKLKGLFCGSTAVIAVMTFCLPVLTVQAADGDLDAVLHQMDTAAANFKSAQADFQWDQTEKIVQATDTQRGTIYFLRDGASTQMAADVREFNGQPEPKYVVFKGGTVQLYQPKIDQLTEVAAGQKREQFESFLTLGFGGSGSDLKKTWNITYQGIEQIDGKQTVKLDLVGKQQSVRNLFDHITIWIEPTQAISLKQEFFEPSGDTRTATYTNIRYNVKIAPTVFTIKTTAKTKMEKR